MNLLEARVQAFRHGLALLLLALLAGLAWDSRATNISFESVGARGGASATSRAHNFHQAEAFANLNLPWNWNLEHDWVLQSRLDVSLGWLADPGGNAVVTTLGPSLWLGKKDFPLSFEAGVSPTAVSRSVFATKNFGGLFQFTSHVGLNVDLPGRFRIGYRFQHMSNAGIGDTNPGLNLHMLAVGCRF